MYAEMTGVYQERIMFRLTPVQSQHPASLQRVSVFISTHGIDLIESFPLFIRHSNCLSSLDRSPHVTRPNLQVQDTLTPDVLTQSCRKLRDKIVAAFIHYLNKAKYNLKILTKE